MLDIKYGDKTYFVLIRSSLLANLTDTMLFGDIESAKTYCNARWKIPTNMWKLYIPPYDNGVIQKLSADGVEYLGLEYKYDDGVMFRIHIERIITEF